MSRIIATRFLSLVAFLCFTATGTLHAQQAPISSDRPGLGNGSAVVNQGIFQAELGYQLDDFDVVTLHNVGQLLLRYGVSDRIELRGGVGSLGFTSGSFGEEASGYLGASIGAKARLAETDVARLSALASVDFPSTASGDFETPNDRARQNLSLLFDGALGSNLGLTVNAGYSFFWDAGRFDDRAGQWSFIPTLSTSINDQVGVYAGYAGFYTEGLNQNFVEGGLTFLTSPNTQLDINAGLQVDDYAEYYFLGLGLAHRF
ncbi:transporter [Salisaeta longa]|uniref:transporter n=1 Tax=Salisaeta longa TaxID=503170 RepID=UPI0003B59F93|nr:transporter [Salisaeta longa]